MATPAATATTTSHPLQPAGNSTESLPTPPRSPTREAQIEHLAKYGAPAPLDHSTHLSASALEAGTSPPALSPGTSPALASLGYFPALTPTTSHDPLLLRDRVQTDEHLSELRKRKKKSLHALYSRQNQQIDDLLKHIDDHVREAEEEEDNNRLAVRHPLLTNAASMLELTAPRHRSRSPSMARSPPTGASSRSLLRCSRSLAASPAASLVLTHSCSRVPRPGQRPRHPPALRRHLVPLALHLWHRHRQRL